MSVVNNGVSATQNQSSIVGALVAHRAALQRLQQLFAWTSGLSQADMETACGISASDASSYLSAIADANAEAQIHFTGQPPGSYPQAASAYPYGASQTAVIGSQ